jgi:hypothetical protein
MRVQKAGDGMIFTVPDKICSRCGDVIPVAGEKVIGRDGRPTTLRTSRLICECWRTGTPRPAAKRLRKGEVHETQDSFLPDCPSIRV